jgi:hypothetical protein
VDDTNNDDRVHMKDRRAQCRFDFSLLQEPLGAFTLVGGLLEVPR